MIGTLLYVFGSCERHSKLTEEIYIPLGPVPKEDTLDMSINWASNRNCQIKVLDTWKVTRATLLCQESIK